jgi:hypothetical protein
MLMLTVTPATPLFAAITRPVIEPRLALVSCDLTM